MANYNASEAVTLYPDGKYRWVYEMNLYTNPTILLLVLKIFFWICFGLWVFMSLLTACESRHFVDDWLGVTKFALIFTAGFLALATFGYYFYALIMGGRYCVLFEMDDRGLLHQQLLKDVKKAHVLAALTSLAGALRGNLTATGIGLNLATRTQQYSDFASVTSVELYRNRDLIKVNAPLNYNQVYASPADFDRVLNHILAHIPASATVHQ